MTLHFKKQSKRDAFTLVEVMVVVAIVGMLATLAIPAFRNANKQSKISRAKNDIRVLSDAFSLYAIEHGNYPLSDGQYVDANRDPAPADLSVYLGNSRWDQQTPLGGHYFYWNRHVYDDTINATRYVPFLMIDNTYVNYFGWENTPLEPTDWFQQLDEDIDDGDLSTGQFQLISFSQALYTLDESTW